MLTKQKQIEWLKNGLKAYKKGKYLGLCGSITWENDGAEHIVPIKLSRYIKGFNITNAKKLAKKYGFSEPTGTSGYYWWPTYIEKPRIKFMQALINEIKNS